MSGQINIHTRETLFSFEVWVDYIRLENQHAQVSDELALALRLLDFPTLIIYQPEKSGGTPPRPDEHLAGGEEPGEQAGPPLLKSEHAFRKGKSCLFKMSMDTLHGQLSNTPLYAMVLDVKGEILKLVGTSLISLAQLVDKIRVDVNARGISTPSSHGQKGHVGILNLMGDTIGLMSVKYKLLSLGTSLLPHILESRTQHHITHEREHMKLKVEQNTCFTQPLHCGQIKSSDLPGENLFISGLSSHMCDVMRDASACVATQTEPMPTYKANQPALVDPCCPFEDNLNVFCPPHMFYNSSGEDTPASQGVDEVKSVQSFTPEATEHRTPERASVMEHNTIGPKQEDPNDFMPNFPGESLRQLPLLNALLVELSQLTRQSVQQPLSIHPNLAWIYSSNHTEPLVGDSTNPTAPTKPLNTPGQMAGFPLAACSTTQTERGSARNNNTKNSNTSAGRKLKYGTTKTFQLRLKQIPPGQVRQRQCMGTLSLSQASKSSPDNKNHTGLIKHDRGKKAVNQTAGLSENAETVIHSVAGDSATREAGGLHMREDQSNHARGTFTAEIAGKGSRELSLRSEADVADRDRSYRHGESTHTRLPSGGKTAGEVDHAGCGSRVCSPHSSPRSASSSSSSSSSSRRGGAAAGREEDQYADDFNSLDPSEGRSTDAPLSSPEPGPGLGPWEAPSESPGSSRGMEMEGFRGRDSAEGPRRRVPALPGPVVARGSPQRSLRGTHVIRPRAQISALSVSSDDNDDDDDHDGDRAVYSSLAAARPRKQTRKTSGADRSSLTESLRSSRGRRSDSARNSGPAGGLSADSGASYDSCEVEELRDELGSLDLKRNYQHISELVANKLPGYTL